MKQVIMLVAAGVMALALTGCEDKPRQPDVNTTVVQPATPVKADETKAPESTGTTNGTTTGTDNQ